jgi:hypothetical protein
MFKYITGIMLSLSVIFLIIVISFNLEFNTSYKISFGQTSTFTDDNNVIRNGNSSGDINSSNIETEAATTTMTRDEEEEAAAALAATGNWLTFSNNQFELKYPPHDWNVEKKLSKFHVLDFKLIKNKPFSFIGISFASLADSDKLTNEIILDESENFGRDASASGYESYDILEKNLTKYKIDTNPSSFHIVKYKYQDKDLEGKLMEIFSMIDKRLFTLTYQSTIDNFDKDLPVVEKIIDSIKIIN